MDIHNEFWINSILSGPKTHIVNMWSNTLHLAMNPIEKAIGGVAGGDLASAREGYDQLIGYGSFFVEAVQTSWAALRKGENILDEVTTFEGPHHAISSGNTGLTQYVKDADGNLTFNKDGLATQAPTAAGKVVDAVGTVSRLPSRFLTAEDEFFKQLAYRSTLKAQLLRSGRSQGLQGKQLASYVSDEFDKGFDPNTGRGLDAAALQNARELTFTNTLDYGISKSLQDLGNKHPGFKVIMPFVRTPANIMRQTWRRTPLINYAQKQWREDLLSGDPTRVAKAKGNVLTGTMMYSAAAYMAYNGQITGGGPVDPKAKSILMETGWRPYSFMTMDDDGNKSYTPYQRMDPWAMFFGLAADTTEIVGQIDEAEADDLAIGIVTAFANNISNKSYMTGVMNIVNALQSPKRYAEGVIRNQAASYVPNAFRQYRQESDPQMREVRSVLDAIRNSIPGYSKDLPAKRSWITGDPVLYPSGEGESTFNPFASSKGKNDIVLQELAQLQHGFSPPDKKIGNVELTSEQFSRFSELHGTLKVGRDNMYQRLQREMLKSGYDINRNRFGDGGDVYTSRRLMIVSKVIGQYRQLAKGRLIQEFPELAKAIKTDTLNQANTMRGRLDKILELNNN
ncbi:hypothetical protein A9Q97_03275 [Rhodospirillales bacterium 47_12_T64]|nr:hypothetical protein A9Q97_03275 [Rhodospirillales bacterium 47_12_T64]